MKQKEIQAVHDYFRDKIVKGQFNIIEITQYTVQIEIDKKYPFNLWCSGAGDDGTGIGTHDSFGEKNYQTITFNISEKKKIWNKIKKRVIEHRKDILLKAKKEEYEALKKQFES